MAEQTERRYNLQPLSPNMIRRPPLADFGTAAAAAGANIGSPAGLQTDSHNATVRARLGSVSQQAKRDALMNLKKMQVEASLNQLNTAMSADQAELGQIQGQVSLDEAKQNDPFAVASNVLSMGTVLGGTLGNLERLMAPKDQKGFYKMKAGDPGHPNDMDYENRGGVAGGVQTGLKWANKILGAATLNWKSRNASIKASGLRQKVIAGVATETEWKEYVETSVAPYEAMELSAEAGNKALAEILARIAKLKVERLDRVNPK